MNRHLYILSFFIAMLSTASCMKDLGNYSYTPPNRITVTGIDSSYDVNYGGRLKIIPNLAFTKDQQEDTANYSYQWVIDHLVGYTMQPIVLSNSRNLDTAITQDFGNYYVYYRVTDKRTKIFTDTYFYLSVGAPSYEGWLLLCDLENGNSRLDMVSHRSKGDTVYPDILKTMSSTYQATGTPAFVETGFSTNPSPPANGTVAIFVGTGKNAVLLGLDTLEYNPNYDFQNVMSVASPITDWTGARLYMGSYQGLLSVGGKVYAMGYSNFQGPVNNTTGGTSFAASPWAVFDTKSGVSPSVLYDTDKGVFYRYPGNGNTSVPYINGSLFDFNTGKDLLYMEYRPFNSGEVFAVLKDKQTGKKYLARFTLRGKQNYYGEITGDGIAGATQFAASPDLGYLFYNAGGKIYEYDAVANRSILMKDYGDRTVSLMKFQHFNSTYDAAPNAQRYISLSKKLVICTYVNGAPASSGMMDLYDIPDINAPLQLYQSFTGGIGKVVSMAYRER